MKSGLSRDSVTLLVLLARTAEAGVVAPDLLAARFRRRHRCLVGAVLLEVIHAAPVGARRRTHRYTRLHRRLYKRYVVDGVGDRVADVLEQLLPHVVGFVLVRDQRVGLT